MRAAALMLCVVLATAACTPDPPAESQVPGAHRHTVTCPAEVEIVIVVPHTCGELVVPEDRSRQGGPSVRLRYVRVLPDEDTAGEVPLLSVGYELAQPPDYGDSVGITQTTGRELVLFSQRGSGLSEPRLDCPETEAEGLLDPPASAAAVRFAAAVGSCRERLVGDGIDPAAYSVAAGAQDIADLRAALGIDRWDLVSWGSASRLLVEYAALEPDAVHAMSLDSPLLPGADPVTGAAENLARAVGALAVACSGAPACADPGEDVASALWRAARRLEAHPVRVTAGGRQVVVGGAALLRSVRGRLASEPLRARTLVPHLVRSALRGRVRPVADILAARPGPCVGYLPLCDAPVSLGAYLSLACPQSDAGVSGPAYPGFGEQHPFLAACAAWDVPPPSVSGAPPVPTLVLWGDLDPFVPADIARLIEEDLADPDVVLVPGVGHDTVSGLDCMRMVRNAWLLQPGQPPNYLDCLRSMQLSGR